MNLKKADADMTTAQLLISSAGNPGNDEALYDLAAYHAQQAIEKALKFLLVEKYGEDESARHFRTHKIYDLIGMLETHGYCVSDELKEMAITITDWEAESRYNDNLVATTNEIKKAIRLYSELREGLDTDPEETE